MPADDASYHTPLAGQRSEATFLGNKVLIPAQNRNSVSSFTVGGSLMPGKQGGTLGLPLGALYLKRVWPTDRARAIVALFVNELEYDKSLGPVEIVSHFENYTLPGGQTEVVDNRELKGTSLNWGSLLASVGPGLRIPVAPFQVDNDLRLQLLGRAGYFYAQRTDDTGAGVVTPPGTSLYGVRLRGRYDGLSRNLIELPHQGVAAGWDLDYLHRNQWRDLDPTGAAAVHQDYYQFTGYLLAAGGLPGLSERNRALLSLYGGHTGNKAGDRFNAFTINGGPSPSEVDDIPRPHYGGILYDDVRSTDYVMGSLTYRRELAFFLYLSLVGSYIWGERATVENGDQVVFRDRRGGAATVSLDSAFFWNSELYLAYCWESGYLRGGTPGSGVMVAWNLSF